jgi:hypothetical protein
MPWLLLSGGFYAIGQQLFTTVYIGLNSFKPLFFRAFIAIFACTSVVVGAKLNGIYGVTLGLLLFSFSFCFGTLIIHINERNKLHKDLSKI